MRLAMTLAHVNRLVLRWRRSAFRSRSGEGPELGEPIDACSVDAVEQPNPQGLAPGTPTTRDAGERKWRAPSSIRALSSRADDQPRRPAYTAGLAGLGRFWVGTEMPDRVIAFIDYEDARSFVAHASGGDGHFDPWALSEAICDELMREAGSGGAPYELSQTCVYRGVPNRQRSDRLAQAWRSKYNEERVYVWENDYDDPQYRTAKELHTTLSVELLNWAHLVATGRSDLAVAVLFSTDRDCAPVIRAIVDGFDSASIPRIDLAAWAGQTHQWRDWRLGDRDVKKHLLTWKVLQQVLESEASRGI